MGFTDVDSGDDKPRDMENIAKKIRSIRLTASNLEKRIEVGSALIHLVVVELSHGSPGPAFQV